MSNFQRLVRTIGSVLVLGGVGGGEIVSWEGDMEDEKENGTAPKHATPRTQEPRTHKEHEIVFQARSAVGVGRGGGLSPFAQQTPGTNVKRDRRGRLTSARRHTHPFVVSSSSSDEALEKPSLKKTKHESEHGEEVLHSEEKSSETPQEEPASKEKIGGQSRDPTASSKQPTPIGSSQAESEKSSVSGAKVKKSALERAERLEAPRTTVAPRKALWVRAEDRNAKSRKADKRKNTPKTTKRSEFLPDVVYLNDVQRVKNYTPHSEFTKELNRVLPDVDVQGKEIHVN